jgi:hypothetical protein
MAAMNVKINVEPTVIVDELLDTLGREWASDHVKGQNEWWKNSVDQYIRDDVPEQQRVILVELLETKPKKNSTFRVIDFGGTTRDEINKAFKRWGDIKAAGRGTSKRTFGGHGNGGKFYMRSAFETSRLITFRAGRLSSFGFNRDKRYGFQEGYDNVALPLSEALTFAGIDEASLPEMAAKRLAASQGFTVVVGEKPNNFQRSATARKILQKLTEHPQARRIIARQPVFARTSSDEGWRQLRSIDPEPRPDFAEEIRIQLPVMLLDENDNEIILRDEQRPEAYLALETSKDSLRGTGLNRIDVIGEIGSIGSHDIPSLALDKHPAHGDFIYGELYCPKLEDPEYRVVDNDRERLINNEVTRVVLAWVSRQVDDLAGRLAEADAKQRQAADLSQSSAFNELLNQWKNRFMPTLMAQLFGGPGEGGGFGGSGNGTGGAGGGDVAVDGDPSDGDGAAEGGEEGGGGDETKRGRRSPTVLLSGQDPDPLDLMAPPLQLSPRQPAVYQRPADVPEGVYWINTSRPLSERILDRFGAESTHWRSYLFDRYVEIILKEAIHQLERDEGGLTADGVEGHIDRVYTQVHDQAFEDLEQFLFDEKLAE